MIAEERANGLLCSTSRARRSGGHAFHDAERFSDRETPLYDYHPAFRVPAAQDDVDVDPRQPADESDADERLPRARRRGRALRRARLAARHGALCTRVHLCARLIDAGTRANAHEVLRRDHHARAFLDLDRRSWSTLLRVVLGSPNPDLAHTAAGRGLLLRLLIDERLDELLADDELVAAISSTAARFAGGAHA